MILYRVHCTARVCLLLGNTEVVLDTPTLSYVHQQLKLLMMQGSQCVHPGDKNFAGTNI